MSTLVFDNIDWKNKDLRGKETHNTNSILIQPNLESINRTKVDLVPDYDYDRKEHKSFKAFKSQLKSVRFERVKCKELEYNESNEDSEYQDASKRNFSWVMARYDASRGAVQVIPSWSGFQHMLSECCVEANVGYLPPITAPPTDMSVIFAFIQREQHILEELEIDQMFIEVDQAIYTKILDAMFKLQSEGTNIFFQMVPRLGGFHVILCMLRTIFARFKDSDLIQWLVYSGVGGEGTVANALKGGDVKHGIHLDKLMFEAILRHKIHYLIENGSLAMDDAFKNGMESLQSDISADSFESVFQQVQMLPILTEGMSVSFELYLDMANLLLNTIYFQRTSNWKGYIQCIKEFIRYCFSLNRHNYARNLSYYYVHMLNLEKSHPALFKHIEDHGFTVSLTGQPFTKIPCDQVIETTINRSSKATGGLSGKTENYGASERWMRINHIMAALRETLDEVTRKNKVLNTYRPWKKKYGC